MTNDRSDESTSKPEATDSPGVDETRGALGWRRWLPWRRVPERARKYVRRALIVLVALSAGAVVWGVTVDLDSVYPDLRVQAERFMSDRLDRPVHIGGLSAYVAPGRFLIEDLVIDGLSPGDDPFFTCERIVISISWVALLRRELLINPVDMENWRMVAESFPDGRQSFPRFVAEADPPELEDSPTDEPASEAEGESASPFVTTIQFLRAHEGEFVYRDHNAPWQVIARDIDMTLEKREAYGGGLSFRGGTIEIRDFEPMTADLDATFDLDGGYVTLTHIDLSMDGFRSTVTGEVDLLNWPEQTYQIVESDIDLPTMKEIFFAEDRFTVDGDAHLTGAWHIFDGGRELTGTFQSDSWTLNDLEFPQMTAALVWTDERFEVFDYASAFYDGTLDLTYLMAPLGAETPGFGTLDATVENTDIGALFDALELAGIRPEGRASLHNVLRWPLDRFDDHVGEGRLTVVPPDARTLMRPGGRRTAGRGGYASVPFDPEGAPWQVPIGGEVTYTVSPEWLEIAPSRVATPATVIDFQGRTAFGDQARVPFQVFSSDWQESSRLMSAVLTALDKPTREVVVGGRGTLDGVMLGAFDAPRIEARFDGEDISAWNVDWGSGTGGLTVENAYLDVANGTFDQGPSQLHVDGRFALGFPRADGGEEINARVRLTSLPAQTLRDTFSIEGYEINGPLTGEFHLFGEYRRPFGSGSLTMSEPTAWGETFDAGTAGLQFEGDGVRLEGLEMHKGDGRVTGAMFVRWNGTYSLNLDGRDILVESMDLVTSERVHVAGVISFAASGAGAFADPRYDVRGTIANFSVDDAVVGQVTGQVNVRGGAMGIVVEAASDRLAVSGSGRVELSPGNDSDLSFRFTNTALDPFVRAYDTSLPEQTAATVSGTLAIDGPLRDLDQLAMRATVEQLQLLLFDYDVRNEGAVELSLDQGIVNIGRMHLVGDRTELAITGQIGLEDEQIALRADGDASLALLQGFFPDIRGSGGARLAADIGGTTRQPVIIGEATVSNGRIRHFSLPHALDDLEGGIAFEPDGVRFDGLSGVLAGGPVQFGGRLGLTGYQLGELNMTASASGMRLRFPEGVRSVVDAELTLRGDIEDAVLSGTVTIVDAIWLELPQPTAGLLDFSSDESALVPRSVDPTFPLRYDVRVLAPSSLRINDRTTRVVASAELTLGGTYDQPTLFGNAEIDRGEFFFEGNRYRVTRGTLGFSDPTGINPFLDVEVETDIRVPAQTYRITLGISGTMDQLVLGLQSDPPLQEPEIISLLLGDTRDPQAAELRSLSAQEESRQELFQAGAARLLTTRISSGVGRVVEDSFGVDSFEIVPALSDPSAQQSAQLLPTARVLIGRRISDRAHVTFSRAVSGANQDLIVVLEYDQNDLLSWVLSQNADRTYALDFRVRHAF